MVASWAKRFLVLVAAVLLPASLLHAALPTDPDVAGPPSLAGQLLVAAPSLRQPAFDRTVIMLARHSQRGALGVVVNRPLAQRPVAELVGAFGLDTHGVGGSVSVFFGGPVEPNIGLVVHTADYNGPETLTIDGRVALTPASAILRDIGLGKGPQKYLVAFGYAGWAPLQLENELAQGAWITVPEDPALIFDEDRAKVWAEALARRKAGR